MLQTVNSQSYAPYTSPYIRKKREHPPLVVEADKFIADLEKNDTNSSAGITRRMGRMSVIIAGESAESTMDNYSTTKPPVTFNPKPTRGLNSLPEYMDFLCEMTTYFRDIHRGVAKLDPDELRQHFERGFDMYKRVAIEEGLTDGNCEVYDAWIRDSILGQLDIQNSHGAEAAQRFRGEEMTGLPKHAVDGFLAPDGIGGTRFNFFHAEYLFSGMETRGALINAAKEFSEERNLSDPALSEHLNERGFFDEDSIKSNLLKFLSQEFELPEGFEPPDRNFYLLFESGKEHMLISGQRVEPKDFIHMTTMEEVEKYLADKGIDLALLQMALKRTANWTRLFNDDNLQKKIDALTNTKTEVLTKRFDTAYEPYLQFNHNASAFFA